MNIACALSLLLATGADESALSVLPSVTTDGFFPAPGSTIPTNARLLIFDSPELELVRVSTGEIVAIERDGDRPEQPGVVDLGPLVPGETVTLRASCPSCSDVLDVSWVVGDGPDVVAPAFADAAPLTLVDVDNFDPPRHGVQICLPPLVTPEPALFVIEHPDGHESFKPVARGTRCNAEEFGNAEGTLFYEVVPVRDDETTLCVTARAVDVAARVGRMPEHCVELLPPESYSSCAQGPGSSFVGVLLGLGAAGLRRRKLR